MAYETKRHGEVDVTYVGGGARDDSTGKPRYDLIPPAPLKRVAELYERGGRIRGDHNWTKGVPVSRFIESAMRHLEQFRAGEVDEDHAAAVVWNILGAMHFQDSDWDDRHDWTVAGKPDHGIGLDGKCACGPPSDLPPGVGAVTVEEFFGGEVTATIYTPPSRIHIERPEPFAEIVLDDSGVADLDGSPWSDPT